MRAVLFDLDDTLFDHRHSAREALREVHRRHAATADFAAFERDHARFLEELHLEVLAGRMRLDDARRQRFRRLLEAFGIRLSDADVDAVAAAYRSGYVPTWRAVEGAVDLLEAVRPHARIGIVSNNLIEETRDKLEACRLAPLVDAVVVSGDEGISKPDPRLFHIALGRLGAGAPDSVVLGDSWAADVVGAVRAGIRPVWFNPRRKPRPESPPDVAEIHALSPAADVLPILIGPGRVRR